MGVGADVHGARRKSLVVDGPTNFVNGHDLFTERSRPGFDREDEDAVGQNDRLFDVVSSR